MNIALLLSLPVQPLMVNMQHGIRLVHLVVNPEDTKRNRMQTSRNRSAQMNTGDTIAVQPSVGRVQ